MSDYHLTWLSDNLAIGHAPMSFDDLDYIRDQGVDGIVNLCGETCDLAEFEKGSGFEVCYLPIEDENAPDREELRRSLDWLKRYLGAGRKVLVHCRFGKGRTATFVISHLLEQGFSLKEAERLMKQAHCLPTSFSQNRFLKKYEKELAAARKLSESA